MRRLNFLIIASYVFEHLGVSIAQKLWAYNCSLPVFSVISCSPARDSKTTNDSSFSWFCILLKVQQYSTDKSKSNLRTPSVATIIKNISVRIASFFCLLALKYRVLSGFRFELTPTKKIQSQSRPKSFNVKLKVLTINTGTFKHSHWIKVQRLFRFSPFIGVPSESGHQTIIYRL